MRFSTIFTIGVFLTALIGAAVGTSYFAYLHNKLNEERIYDNLKHVADSSAIQVDLFLKGKKDRAVDFSSDGFIKNSLKSLKENPDSEEIMQKLNEHLINNKIIVDKSFYEIFVLNNDGKVVGTTNEKFGEDFSQDLLFTEGKKAAYIKDIFYDGEFRRNGIVLSAPILDKDEFLGVIAIRMLLDELIRIVVKYETTLESTQIYLINSDSVMITPSRFLRGEKKGSMQQVIDSQNSRDCIGGFEMYETDKEKLKLHEDDTLVPFLDFRGERVLGAHAHALEAKWGLLAEINEEDISEISIRDFIKSKIIIPGGFVAIFTLFGFFVGKLLDKKYLLKK